MSVVLMGDPGEFEILHGSNPHTRDFWGRRKHVDRAAARRQWLAFKTALESGGVRAHVLPPVADCPGLVYPANAGIVCGRDFYPSNLLPARAPERPHYEKALAELGFSVNLFGDGKIPFEGEADFFPWGERMILTYGRIERQRMALTWRFPFYRRIYGFRTATSALEELRGILRDRKGSDRGGSGGEILALELCDERFYHGDTCLCSFGAHREYLLAHPPALTASSQAALRAAAKDRLVLLNEADALCYAANSYAVTLGGSPHLFMPKQASDALKRRIETLGVTVHEVDVSEFLKKGGGSVKCMVFSFAGADRMP